MCSSTLAELAGRTSAFAAGVAQVLYARLVTRRNDLLMWDRLAALEARVPPHATLLEVHGRGTWWARLGFGLLDGSWELDAWLSKVVLGSPAPAQPLSATADAQVCAAMNGDDSLGLGDGISPDDAAPASELNDDASFDVEDFDVEARGEGGDVNV